MNYNSFLLVSMYLLFQPIFSQEKKDYEIQTIAFYNVENLFDTEDDPDTFDDDRTANGKDAWNFEKYKQKIEHISQVLSEIGKEVTKTPPSIIGLCEIENKAVLEGLVSHPNLKDYHYGIVHYDSPDERGIDVALLYRKEHFQPINSKARKLILYESDNPGKRDYTRDQLVVSGLLNKEEIHFIVNHWPSRGGGEARSAYKREKAAYLNKRIIDSLIKINPEAKIISMGDFNDDPTNKSFKKILNTKPTKKELLPTDLYNPMENMLKQGKGSLAYRDSWNLFDQMFMTGNLVLGNDTGFQFYQAGIFNKPYLITTAGQFRGYPSRTYGYSGYEGGYSDHFPVYIYLIRDLNSK
ncbi:endonuclease [Christiangramia forsetii]|uniref:Endonuclease/exonuclease/phosphatase family protein n=2 Tax=Christiangramia forsetii TaxID=411153 RepID=A0M662_CHRFK|nr:endonuclease [Christiangramia forsetii]GGG31279.1 endonuclease [Christiangramia forsetii]CAL68107.1 endonuclease/exonuclease/phosphatase family protein [Christiangramia forsetii KT0803]